MKGDSFTVYAGKDYEIPYHRGPAKDVLNWLLDYSNSGIHQYTIRHDAMERYMSAEEFKETYWKLIRREDSAAEQVDHPAHYNQYPVEVIDLIEEMPFNRGSIIKYVARAGFKSKDTELQDLMKARFYIDREIQRVEKKGVKE